MLLNHITVRLAACVASCLLLTSCFLTPGNFEAYLAMDSDGRYRFTYNGEMQLILPEDRELQAPIPQEFDPEYEVCRRKIDLKTGEVLPLENADEAADAAADAAFSGVEAVIELQVKGEEEEGEYDENGVYQPLYRYENRECSEEELAKRKEQYALRNQARQAEFEERIATLNSVFGGAIPGDDASMEKLAKKLESYQGWNSVIYQGENVFLVNYGAEGVVSGGFVFPLIPDAAMNFPFLQIIPKGDGQYEVLAPAFAAKGSLAILGALDRGGTRRMEKQRFIKPSGTFTISTDGEVLANNSKDGLRREYGRRIIEWKILEGLESPRALIGPAQ